MIPNWLDATMRFLTRKRLFYIQLTVGVVGTLLGAYGILSGGHQLPVAYFNLFVGGWNLGSAISNRLIYKLIADQDDIIDQQRVVINRGHKLSDLQEELIDELMSLVFSGNGWKVILSKKPRKVNRA